MPQTRKVCKAEVEQLGAVLLGEFQHRFGISFGVCHSRISPLHRRLIPPYNTTEIECFYGWDKERLYMRKSRGISGLDGGKTQHSAFSHCTYLRKILSLQKSARAES